MVSLGTESYGTMQQTVGDNFSVGFMNQYNVDLPRIHGCYVTPREEWICSAARERLAMDG